MRTTRRTGGEDGFTLVEMVITIGFTAFIFAALASVMASAVRSLAVAKARTQGNEIATQGIEDLQRYTYDQLGLCATPPNPPEGLGNTVSLPNCPAGSTTSYGESPCASATGQTQVPEAVYTCSRLNITFNVSRYIAWSNTAQTAKRLAVFVTWTDHVGQHTVSQQSSVRAPEVASVIGLSPPVLTSPVVNPTTIIESNGVLQGSLSLSVAATGLCGTSTVGTCTGTPDKVFAQFWSVDSQGNPTASSIFLTPSADGSSWTGQLSASSGFMFGEGSQFLSFTALRNSDGKGNTAIPTGTTKFCSTSDTNCAQSSLPSFVGSPTVPSSVSITASGALQQNVSVSATLKNVTSLDTVAVGFQTLGGFVSTTLQPNTSSCSQSSCTFSGTIPQSAGYGFAKGSQPLYFTAVQVDNPDPSAIDQGNMVAAASSSVSFG